MGKFSEYLDRKGIEYLPDKLIKEFRRVARKEIVIDGDNVTFRIKWDYKLSLDRFKTFVRKNLFLISGILIAVASAVTAVVLVIKQSLKGTARRWSNADKGGGGGKGGDEGEETDWTPLKPAARALDWLSDNLILQDFYLNRNVQTVYKNTFKV